MQFCIEISTSCGVSTCAFAPLPALGVHALPENAACRAEQVTTVILAKIILGQPI